MNVKGLIGIGIALSAGLACEATMAHVNVGINLGVPVYAAPVYAAPAPVYVEPAPVCRSMWRRGRSSSAGMATATGMVIATGDVGTGTRITAATATATGKRQVAGGAERL